MLGLLETLTGLMMKTNATLKTMKTMKKNFVLLSAALVSFALASCQKEIDTPEEPVVEPKVEEGVIPFALNAHIAETKTTLNTSTYAVTWQDTDVLYAVTTDAAWGDGDKDSDSSGDNIATFTYDGDKFTTDKAIATGSHTFNFIYEGSGQKKYHRATGTTHQLYATQAVDAENPAQNLKANDALVGQITETIPATLADITFSHIYTLMKVTIKNKLGSSVTASKFEIEIDGEDIAGVFDVAFDTPGATIKSGGTDKITVNITNGSIANNGSIDIYFVMAPVEDFTGNVTFTVTDSESKTYTKTNSVSDLTFAAGTYNTANFSLKPAPSRTYTRITSYGEIISGDYLIVGKQSASSLGVLTYASLNSSRIPYTKTYSSEASLPSTIDCSDGNQVWHLTVSGSPTKSATIYNAQNDKYIKANSGISYQNAANASSFTIDLEDGLFQLLSTTTNSTYLVVNPSSDYWRDYATSTVSEPHVLALYQYVEETTLSSIALSGTYPTEFYEGNPFSTEGLIVTATYANGKYKVVTPTSITSPDMSTAADDVEITVSYTEGGVTKTDSYTIDILAASTNTVTWIVNGSTYTTTTPNAGPNLALPDDPVPASYGMTGYTFMGWTLATSVNSNGTSITYAANGDSVSSDVSYYAVFAKNTDTTETLTVGTNGGTWTNSQKTASAQVGIVSFTGLGSGSNDTKYYSSDNTWRFYTQDSSGVQIDVPSGYTLKQVDIAYNKGVPSSPSDWTKTGTSSPLTFTPNTGITVRTISFYKSTSANLQITSIAVKYNGMGDYRLESD